MSVEFGVNCPAPPLHCPPPALAMVPLRSTCGLFAQTVWFAPALATGAGPIKMVITSFSETQFPLFVLVRVRVTCPLEISVAAGEYTAFRLVEPPVKVPSPPLHCPPAATDTEPLSATSASLAQTKAS